MPKDKIIMVVDDNKDILYTVKRGLESLNKGYKVYQANGGKKCLKMLENGTCDLILLDLMMPDMDGWTVFAKLKAKEKTNKIPVIFLTALTDKMYKETEKLKGIKPTKIDNSNYVMKPFDVNDLDKKIEMFIGK